MLAAVCRAAVFVRSAGLICSVIHSTCAHLYRISSFGSTDRTTGLLSIHCKNGVSSLVL